MKSSESTDVNDRQLRVMFVTTSMPVGGAETLLVNLVRGMDKTRFAPEIACLKERGPLGEELASELPVHCQLLTHKFDLRVLPRLRRLMCSRKIDALVTVGAGDKMFWGRLAARLASVPVVISALHSTGWPDSVGRLNRLLTPWTDAFIGVADSHARHLVDREGFPESKVHTIYNGIDTRTFFPAHGRPTRSNLGLPLDAPIVGILAALRPEKNHELFLSGAKRILAAVPATHFVVVGDGPRRSSLEQQAGKLGIDKVTHFLGSRSDVPELLRVLDVLALTSHNEASPVSILEALSSGVPVVSANVGSVSEIVLPDINGRLFSPGNLDEFVTATVELLQAEELRSEMGREGRKRIKAQYSLEAMVRGYESLIKRLHSMKIATVELTAHRGLVGSAPLSGRG